MSALSDYYDAKKSGQTPTQAEIQAAQSDLAQQRAAYMASHPGVSVADAGLAVMTANGSPYVSGGAYIPMNSGETMAQYQQRITGGGTDTSTGTTSTGTSSTGTSSTGTSTSTPKEGDTQVVMVNGALEVIIYHNGTWYTQEEIDAMNGTGGTSGTDTTGTTGTSGTGGTDFTNILLTGGNANTSTEETYSPFTAYLQAKGLGNKNYYNPAENYTINQYDPLSNIYDMRRLMSTVDPSINPGDYVSPWAAANTGNATSLAKNTLSQLMGYSDENQGLAGLDFSPIYNGTDSVDSNNSTYLKNILQTGLRGVLGQYLASKVGWEQQQWGNNQANGGTGTFLDYLKNKYKLGSLV